MAVSDLTNTTWYFNNYVDTSELVDVDLTFVSNGNTYTHFLVDDDIGKIGYKLNNSFVWVTDASGEWIDQSYRTIEITGGTDVTNDAFITWLEAWAVQQVDEPDVIYDLTQLDSYLVPGTSYTVTAKAVATGYADSVASNSVTYVPSAPSGYEVSIIIDAYVSSFNIYDGTSTSGTLLYTHNGGDGSTDVTCLTGNLYFRANTRKEAPSVSETNLSVVSYDDYSLLVSVSGTPASLTIVDWYDA